MGKLMLYGAGRACQSITAGATEISGGYSVNTYHDIDGNSFNTLYGIMGSYFMECLANLNFLKALTGYVSSDTVFNKSNYATNALPSISYFRTSSSSVGGTIYTITATNNGSAEVTVGSLKFTKTLYTQANSRATNKVCLICGYFLDEPVTIEAGKTKTFAVNIDCWNY